VRTQLAIAVGVVVLVAGLATLARVRGAVLQERYELGKQVEQVRMLHEEAGNLRAELAAQRDPQRIRERARRELGFELPTEAQVLR